jgi:hypothetical protein
MLGHLQSDRTNSFRCAAKPTFASRIDSELKKLSQQLQQKSLEKEDDQNNDHILYSTIKLDVP